MKPDLSQTLRAIHAALAPVPCVLFPEHPYAKIQDALTLRCSRHKECGYKVAEMFQYAPEDARPVFVKRAFAKMRLLEAVINRVAADSAVLFHLLGHWDSTREAANQCFAKHRNNLGLAPCLPTADISGEDERRREYYAMALNNLESTYLKRLRSYKEASLFLEGIVCYEWVHPVDKPMHSLLHSIVDTANAETAVVKARYECYLAEGDYFLEQAWNNAEGECGGIS